MTGFVNCEIYATKALDIAIIRRRTSEFFFQELTLVFQIKFDLVPAFYLLV